LTNRSGLSASDVFSTNEALVGNETGS
jgi:hypothetical protein